MDVTTRNFKETLPEVLQAIDSCDFLAIDGEFSGLRKAPDLDVYDTPASHYSKLLDGSMEFLLIQVGLCTFKLDRSKNKYVYKAFNFYVFPRAIDKKNQDINFLFQASAINFLSDAGFDFNKLYKEGIPYSNAVDEKFLLEELTAKYEFSKQSESSPKVRIPEDLSSTIEDTCARIKEFLLPENEEKEIVIDQCNAFLRKLIFQTAYERFSTDNFSLSTRWIDNRLKLVAQKGKSKEERDKEKYESDRNEIIEAVGFSKIIRHISNSKKLIVGHNMLLDICHMVNRFCEPLPNDYRKFKATVNQLFPRIIDTKYMCSAYPFRDLIPSTAMDHIVKRIKEFPFEFLEADPENPSYSYSIDESKAHQAGYDAYITGLIFISLISYLGENSDQNSLQITPEILEPFENKLPLVKIIDYSYICLDGDEPEPYRDHVFHVTFPKEWKTNDIMRLFRPYGDVRVSYCNSISAWVTFRDRGEAQEAIAGLIKSKKETSVRKPYKIITWSEFSQRNSTGERRSNNPSNNPHGLFARSNQKSRVNNLPGRSATKSNENNSLVSNDQSETILAQKTLD